MKKVLFVLTSHDQLGDTGEKTGFWIEEFANPYYFFIDKGIYVDVATPLGGQAPIDPKSGLEDFMTAATQRFNKDIETQKLLSETSKLETVSQTEYDALFFPGGHGPLWDLSHDSNSISLIESFYQNNKPIAAVCHAPAVFMNTKDEEGNPLVKGKEVTSFSNSEEEAVQLSDVVPFLVEDMLKENGAIYSKGEDWTSHCVKDGLLITGQNPASSGAVAQTLFESIK